MNIVALVLAAFLALLHGVPPSPRPSSSTAASATAHSEVLIVTLETTLGNITLMVDAKRAPITSANFLKYVDGGFYDGGEFHRAIRPDNEVRPDAPIQVVQARINPAKKEQGFPPIALEPTSVTGIHHLNGTVSMARDVTPKRPGPDTATSGIFICIGDEPSLDDGGLRAPDHLGFAAFGHVIDGMDVVKKIQSMPTPANTPSTNLAAKGQTLIPTVKIIRAYRKYRSN
jgi:peptidyl-prolyl cis-trans isomerase A (cyclophilin A)